MPAEPVRFHRLAAQEYRVASDWYRKRDASVADRFRNAVDFAINRLRSDPNSHEQIFDGIYSIRLRRFPYLLIYVRDHSENLLILAVAHAKRRSAYWKRRR